MKITTLEKKKRLYLLETDTNEKCYVTEDTIVRFFLSKGKEIGEEEWKEIRDFAQFSYGKNLALYHLSFKSRSTKEVRDYLTQHEIEATAIEKIIANLKENNWLNDKQLAESFIRQNSYSGDKGPLVLQQKLAQKGISSTISSPLLDETDFSETASRIAQKLLRKYGNKLPQKALKDKIIQQLQTKGFTYSQAKIAHDELEIASDEELEQELIYKEFEKQYRKYSRKYEGYELKQRLTQALARKGYDFDQIQRLLRDYL